MFDNFSTKAFEWAWGKGLVLMLVWVFGSRVVYSAEKLFGFMLSDADRGLIVTILALTCIALHFFVRFWIAREKFYSPNAYRDDVVSRLNAFRDFLNDMRFGLLSADGEMITGYDRRLRENIGLAEDIDQWDALRPLVQSTRSLHVHHNIGQLEGVDEHYETALKSLNDFLKKTKWAAKK